MISITRRFTFSAAHRLAFHEGRCKEVHGHNYTVEVTVARPGGGMGPNRMVLDFGDLKRPVKQWLDEHWDHTIILDADDKETIELLRSAGHSFYATDGPPTAENMAQHLLQNVLPGCLPPEMKAIRVAIWETEGCKATAEV